jgi:polysaccharide pyruvyl transferase WcaK-like protein
MREKSTEEHPVTRRQFLIASIATALSASALAEDKRQPRILLRSSWKTDNIGDIGHTPGILAALEEHCPGIEVRLWPSLPHGVADGVEQMLLKRFPKLRILKDREAIDQAFAECSFFLHGSGPSLVAHRDLASWREKTGKPYGVAGITLVDTPEHFNESIRDLMNHAQFLYFRDSPSFERAKQKGVSCPVMGFGPDAAFAVDLRDDAKAEAFLQQHKLETGRFLVCIPAHRRTPRWLVPRSGATYDAAVQTLNDRFKDRDHAPHREAIIRVVRETGMKVLICAEQITEIPLGREALYDPLPEDVKKQVVFRDSFWLTDEAVSVFARSAGLFGNEMHSPIMCIGNGIPAIVCRWDTQTTKGFMWRDIGLGEWLFDFEKESELPRLAPAVVALAKDPSLAKAKAAKARGSVRLILGEVMSHVRRCANG